MMRISIADPRIPALIGMLAALLWCSAAGIYWLPRVPWGQLGSLCRTLPRSAGLIVGLFSSFAVALLGQALNLQGLDLVLFLLLALVLVLGLGFYVPGLEARQHEVRRKRLALQTIDLAGSMLLALSGPYGDVAILRAYIRRPRRAVRDLQQLVADVLAEHQRVGRGNVLDRLHGAAHESSCRELVEVTATLREVVQQDRSQVAVALAQQRHQLIEATIATFQQRAQRIEFVILGLTAGALFFGLLAFILYVMTGGGTLIHLG